MKKIFLFSLFLGFFFFSLGNAVALATSHCGAPPLLPCSPPPTCGAPPLLPCPGSGTPGASGSLQNPLAFNTIQSFLVAVLNVMIVVLTPIVVIFIILAGFQYVTARGNPAKIESATKALTYAVIGGVLIIGAVALSGIIQNLVTAI